MQRTLVAITLALALTCASAAWSANGYVKAPVVVVQDSETNFTNQSQGIGLAAVTIGDIYLTSLNFTLNTANTSASSWMIWLRKLDSKALTTGANSSYTITNPAGLGFYNNYAISLVPFENDTGIPQIRIYQVPLTGGSAVGRLTVSSNANATFSPGFLGMAVIKKMAYVFYEASSMKVNFTSFTLGGAMGSGEYTITSAFNGSFSVVWGESLSSSSVFAAWKEGEALKDGVIDLSKGTISNGVTVGGYGSGVVCEAYATDKKWYGELCRQPNTTSGVSTYWVRTNTSNLVQFATYNMNSSGYTGSFAYGPYLVLTFTDLVSVTDRTAYNYEIWNLDTLALFKTRTQYLTADKDSTFTNFRVPQGGVYSLIWNRKAMSNATLTGINVGLLLGGSYLVSVFGFLLTIIAGLFLF